LSVAGFSELGESSEYMTTSSIRPLWIASFCKLVFTAVFLRKDFPNPRFHPLYECIPAGNQSFLGNLL
jgi:hypothetical protein